MSLLGIIKKTAAVFTAAVLVTLNVFPAEAMSAYVPLLESPAVRSIPLEENAVQFRSLENAGVYSDFSLLKYKEVDEEEAIQKQTLRPGEIASSSAGAAAGADAAISLAPSVEAGQFAFTTYGYGHGVGMSQNGANAYATYGGYNYQQILFHYYPGTSLIQTEIPSTVTAGGRTGSVLDVVSMIVYNEMSSTMHVEAMKAQAVAAYTIIMHPDKNVAGLICKANPPENVKAAVKSVLGQALTYNGKYALTVFSASSGGYTANSYDVFRTNYPYLISTYCPYDAAYDPHYGTVTYMSKEKVRSRLQNAYGVSLSGNAYSWISLKIGGGGYITSAVIGGTKTVTGESLRSVLGLKSGRFTFVVG